MPLKKKCIAHLCPKIFLRDRSRRRNWPAAFAVNDHFLFSFSPPEVLLISAKLLRVFNDVLLARTFADDDFRLPMYLLNARVADGIKYAFRNNRASKTVTTGDFCC